MRKWKKKVKELGKGSNNKKPTQSRYWRKDEHERFLEALEKFGKKDVKSIASYVGTRNPTQVRTHAQKWFLKQAKHAQFFNSNAFVNPKKRESERKTGAKDKAIQEKQHQQPQQSVQKVSEAAPNNTINNIISSVNTNHSVATAFNGRRITPDYIGQLYGKTMPIEVQQFLYSDECRQLVAAWKVYESEKDYNQKIHLIQKNVMSHRTVEEIAGIVQALQEYTSVFGINSDSAKLMLAPGLMYHPNAAYYPFFLATPSPLGNITAADSTGQSSPTTTPTKIQKYTEPATLLPQQQAALIHQMNPSINSHYSSGMLFHPGTPTSPPPALGWPGDIMNSDHELMKNTVNTGHLQQLSDSMISASNGVPDNSDTNDANDESNDQNENSNTGGSNTTVEEEEDPELQNINEKQQQKHSQGHGLQNVIGRPISISPQLWSPASPFSALFNPNFFTFSNSHPQIVNEQQAKK